jgi:tripartite-type tricarboxylate transporter receptor subunit TctC
MIKRSILFVLVAFGIIFSIQFEASAKEPMDYPNEPINVLIGFGAGGSTDVTMRVLSDLASKIVGRPLLCENKVGASSKIELAALAKAAPDGYTIGTFSVGVATREPHMVEVQFNTLQDFTPIMQYTEYPFSISVMADSPWKSLKELVAAMKEDPGKFVVANSGTYSGGDLAWRVIAKQEGIDIKQIPYAGGGSKAVLALLGGHVQAVGCGGEANPFVREGKMRLLAVLGEGRLPYFPDVPTLKELGYPFVNVSGVAIAGPKNLPKVILKKLEHALTEASKDPRFQDTLKKFDLPYVYKNSEELEREIPVIYANWGVLLKRLGIISK